jgi:hypothetical protein
MNGKCKNFPTSGVTRQVVHEKREKEIIFEKSESEKEKKL